MNAPRLYPTAALIFWGWQVETLWIALPLGIVLIYAQWTRTRVDFSVSDFNRFVDASIIFLAAATVYGLVDDPKKAIWILLKWLPLVFFPIIGAQQFSLDNRIDVRSFYLAGRKRAVREVFETRKIDFTYIYVLFCVLSAGTSPANGQVFFPVAAAFIVWGLWSVRSKRVPAWGWILFVVIIMGSSWAGSKMVFSTSLTLRQWMVSMYMSGAGNNPFKSATAFGEIGRLKMSNKIVMRAVIDNYEQGDTLLLYNGVYNQFVNSSWYARNTFSLIAKDIDNDFWQMNPDTPPAKTAKIYSRPAGERAVLNLPAGTMRVFGFTADHCRKNAMQVVRVTSAPSLIVSNIEYTGTPKWDQSPYKTDYAIPKKEAAVISSVADELALKYKSPLQARAILQDYFAKEFSYSLELKGSGSYDSPIQNFLLNTKQGHCELFATATVLLLRQAGIPARYVTGYLGHEYSAFEKKVVIRQRDAHAWVRMFVNGQWQDLDTTPVGFQAVDANISSVSAVSDFFSLFGFTLSRLRHETGRDLMDRFGLWLILPLGIILFFRLKKARHMRRVARQPGKGKKSPATNDGNSFYLVEAWLVKKGFVRKEYETYTIWLERIRSHLADEDLYLQIKQWLDIHNRIVFGKHGKSIDVQRFNDDIKRLVNSRRDLI